MLLLDGFAARVVTSDGFVAEQEIDMLNEQVTLLLDGPPASDERRSAAARRADHGSAPISL